MADEQKTVTEEFKVSGASLMDEIKKLIHEGNVTHIVVRDEAGQTVFETPIAIGIVGVLLLTPLLAALAALLVLAAHYTISVTRVAP